MEDDVIKGYADDASALIPRYEAVLPAALFAHVIHLFPVGSHKIVDIGAGTGRAAAWFAARGGKVLAVEPVAAFREAGETLHRSPRIEWLDDTLPTLAKTLVQGEQFDLVLMSAVWHHLTSDERQQAMPALWALTAQRGHLVISVRQGAGAASRPCYDAPPDELVDLATTNGFRLVFRQGADSIQAGNKRAGITWTWLVFAK